jgi:predicted acetylornithine/succinylornithine family transaminase/N-acetyl-ornithine/N-acetyl-lysine deacetylase
LTTIIDLENTYTSGVYSKRPVVIVRGRDALLWDEEGREYIDCAAGHGVANIGHGRAEIAAALAAQAQRLITCPEIVYNDVRARLLERLAHLTPEGLTHIFLCNSGTEAVEGALKFARLATGRRGIVAMLRSFHGRTMGALSTTWEPHYREPFVPLVPGVSHIRYNNLAAAEAAIGEETAAVIVELVQGEGGVYVASDEFVHGLASLCRERGALLIIDEVQTGFGRTGRFFACNHYDLQPDILCLAKSLAGGIPMGAICLGPRVTESGRITKGVHGSTFGGNPLACAVALATLDILEQEALTGRSADLGAYALQRLKALRTPLIREVRGRGLLLGIELRRRAQPYLEALLERGILALPAGPNVIRLLPPLVITGEQLEHVLEVLEEVLMNEEGVAAPFMAPGGWGTNLTPEALPHPGAINRDPTMNRGSMPLMRHGENHNSEGRVERSWRGQADAGRPHADAGRPQGSPLLYATPRTAPVYGPGSVQSNHQNELALLYNMLTIPSYSRQERALAHYLVDRAQQMGLYACMDDVGNFIASTGAINRGLTINRGPTDTSLQPIILLGHMDTVGGYIPVNLQDGVLYGRGAVDAKGPLAAFLCATARFAREIPPDMLQHPIVVIGAIEEEAATSRGARAVVGRYQPLACVIGEPSGSSAVTIGYKGRLLVDYRVTRSIHHSAGPQQNSSEVATAFWNRVCQHASDWNQQHVDNSAFAALTPSLRSINSNHDGLEEQTRLCIGYRLPPGYDIDGLRSKLERWAYEDEAQLSFSGLEEAFQTTRTTPLARTFIKAIGASGGKASFKRKTGTSDMNVVGPAWGQNIVAYGPGDSRLDHTPQEHILIAEYIQAIDVLELVLRELALQEGVTP